LAPKLGAVHKDVRSQKEGRLSSADKGWRVFFRCERPRFLAQKTPDFSKFMVCPHRQGGGREGVEPVRTRGGVNFSWFCADVFYRQPLTKHLY